jgi:hypothetical protein
MYYYHPIYLPSFHHLLNLIIIFLPRSLVANERFQTWWPLEGEGEGETSFSPLCIFLLNKFYLNLFFSIDIKVFLYHGSKTLLYAFPFFSLTYKLQPQISTYQIFHTFITKLILIEEFLPFLEFIALCMTMFYGL